MQDIESGVSRDHRSRGILGSLLLNSMIDDDCFLINDVLSLIMITVDGCFFNYADILPPPRTTIPFERD